MYKKILVPLDGSALAECVLPHVEAIGKGCSVKEVHLLRVIREVEPPPAAKIRFTEKEIRQFEADRESMARDYLTQVVERLKFDWTEVNAQVLRGRHIALRIVEYARENAVDLIIIATHGRSGIGRWVWGSNADRILRTSATPILMIRGAGVIPEEG
jgi:nucleotide-binding universal stress UspA family protein